MNELKNNMPPWMVEKSKFGSWLVRSLAHIFALAFITVVFYVCFSYFFDTKAEYNMKKSTEKLNSQYEILTQRFDSLNLVIDNIEQRDANVFKILFEAEPYDLDKENNATRWRNHERLFSKTNKELNTEFSNKLKSFESKITELDKQTYNLVAETKKLGSKTNYIPAIQPVINKELTKIAASYGMRMHPFYRTLTSHQGIDFSVVENSRIFATADGTISNVNTKSSSSGNSITIDHGNGYKTLYNHLGKINVKLRQKVRRGDIIALSGNSGLSFSPHLHYEIIKDGMRIDPIHYFFMELNHNDYQKIMTIAQSGMQSLD